MSEENLRIAARFESAIKAREVPEEILAPGFVLENVSTAVTERTYEGADGIRQWFDDFLDLLGPDAFYRAEPVESGDDYVLGRITLSGRGRASGFPVDLTHWGILWIRDGKVASAVGFATKREALEAIGRQRG